MLLARASPAKRGGRAVGRRTRPIRAAHVKIRSHAVGAQGVSQSAKPPSTEKQAGRREKGSSRAGETSGLNR